ncbi:xanthine dehydrogenase accessory factor [Anoxybacillus voinovskiensis]|uniref:Xanthine dehydrogenase accessory factor n=1 Tax=Anoxybacteroides voinovskiense TaxID=230470 RepID=A0A840DJW5_9BACL|nr:XdhC family protein [Anoxybacillus voinovskiensis]MBB4073364.1 xanthine dehydrogenase accessory factor [Anoxybacillus voinovskiensis]GGJ61859.1 putative xanthine dehydrogenase subunit A [Anoxybacillus voinovskiensis]
MEYHLLEIVGHCSWHVLATIIHVEGSSYQKEGTCMLFGENGAQMGILSGGCLEEDLAAKADDVWRTKTATVVVYDLTQEDDFSWGQVGCNGTIHVLLQPLTASFRAHLLAVKACLDRGEHVVFARPIDKLQINRPWLFVTESGQVFGELSGIHDELINILQTTPSFSMANGICTIGNLPIYVHHFWPKPRLILFGANPDVRPLASFAHQLGFRIIVVDWRPAYADAQYFPFAEIKHGFPREVIPTLSMHERDFVVVMTHHFQRDQEILALLRDKPLYYLGVLSSKARTARLFSGHIPSTVRSPAGLAIRARSPEEIAISIVAEMIEALRGGKG